MPVREMRIDWNRVRSDSYLRQIPAVKDLEDLVFGSSVTIFCGENGSGKSTVLEALAVSLGFNPEGGTVNYRFSTYDSHSELSEAVRLVRGTKRPAWGYFLRAESFYNVASAEEEYGKTTGRSQHYHERSHGESFLLLAQNTFRGDGVYLLDEPEAALSPQRQLTLLLEIVRCAREGSQFFLATHSPILLGIPGAQILLFDEDGVRPVSYEDTDSYRITKMFIEDRERILHNLLADG